MIKTNSTKNSEKSRNLEETHLTENHNPVLEFLQKSKFWRNQKKG